MLSCGQNKKININSEQTISDQFLDACQNDNESSIQSQQTTVSIVDKKIKKKPNRASKYNRISPQSKQLLLEKIFFQGKNIKNASEELKINYSSAKTIISLYRKKQLKKHEKNLEKVQKSCSFRFLNLNEKRRQKQVQGTMSINCGENKVPIINAQHYYQQKNNIIINQKPNQFCQLQKQISGENSNFKLLNECQDQQERQQPLCFKNSAFKND
ncbi:hypothetical protein PPERSA_00792 [Pseudocohnilembus persalinus]|uniref:Uncharacterized protein n=1 Tax=Pseudocohnilembus persalinus TaxID=266149 RepID=A0A0V0QFS1_PSEPJ|nr:hypothetical protein PPERSA_00792 [Pseudocohnilembus persalinus]|eukprot:KRX01044.1 hypothetical protein PPERSA_00792 [Pseudocohnilembus persalinus]